MIRNIINYVRKSGMQPMMITKTEYYYINDRSLFSKEFSDFAVLSKPSGGVMTPDVSYNSENGELKITQTFVCSK